MHEAAIRMNLLDPDEDRRLVLIARHDSLLHEEVTRPLQRQKRRKDIIRDPRFLQETETCLVGVSQEFERGSQEYRLISRPETVGLACSPAPQADPRHRAPVRIQRSA